MRSAMRERRRTAEGPRPACTSLVAEAGAGDRPARLIARYGPVAPRIDLAEPGVVRANLVATVALLLGGDDIEVSVLVRRGVRLDLNDVAATVAHHGRGRHARWTTRIRLEEDAELTWAMQPIVVSDGAIVDWVLVADVEGGGVLRLSDAVVLGRHGQHGGRLRSVTRVTYDGGPSLCETTVLSGDPTDAAEQAFVRGSWRRLDTSLRIGGADHPPPSTCDVTLSLAHGGTVTRRFS